MCPAGSAGIDDACYGSAYAGAPCGRPRQRGGNEGVNGTRNEVPRIAQ